jgi:HSP20 family protein
MATDTRHGKNGTGSMSTGGSQDVPTRRSTAAASDMRRHASSRDVSSGPFGLMRQMQDEVDRWFDRAGLGRGWTSPSAWAAAPSSWMSRAAEAVGDWTPAIDAFQRNNEFVVRLDVPGMTRNDLNVEVGEDSLTISGERKQEHSDERDGVFWSERSYGTFSRVVPLPPGAISDSAKATFNNGVLEIVMQAPSPATRRGRKIDISGHDHESGGKKTL